MSKARFQVNRENKISYVCLAHMQAETRTPGAAIQALPDNADIQCEACYYDRMLG